MGIVYNEQQAKTVEDGVNWFKNSSEQIFEIDGHAGTGKSVVLYGIINALGLKPYQYIPMAYTGQASIIMRLKGFPHARSIHSWLYTVKEVQSDYASDPFNRVNTMFNTVNKKRVFVPLDRGELDKNIRLMVVDEGYMVPEYMKQNMTKHGIKILVAGDAGQLPPIDGKPAFLTGYNIHHLTQLMRQKENNPIIYIAERARKGLPIHNGLYGNRVLVIDDTELNDALLLNVGNVICGTNKTRDYFNRKTRELLGTINSQLPMYGERVICRNNNWNITQDNIALANGLSGVISAPISINSFNGETFSADFLPDLLNNAFKGLNMNYEYLVSPPDIRNQMKASRFTKGELFEYAYAITTHLAQGAEYNSGIYFEEFLRSNIQNQLNYTGVSRFREYMVYVKRTKKYY